MHSYISWLQLLVNVPLTNLYVTLDPFRYDIWNHGYVCIYTAWLSCMLTLLNWYSWSFCNIHRGRRTLSPSLFEPMSTSGEKKLWYFGVNHLHRTPAFTWKTHIALGFTEFAMLFLKWCLLNQVPYSDMKNQTWSIDIFYRNEILPIMPRIKSDVSSEILSNYFLL